MLIPILIGLILILVGSTSKFKHLRSMGIKVPKTVNKILILVGAIVAIGSALIWGIMILISRFSESLFNGVFWM